METRRNHNRTTGAQDHRTIPQQATRSKTDALEGFLRRLETARGKYTLSNTKRKYKAARHSKQAYNSRLTIQARHQNRTITDFSGFQKYQNSVKNINIPIFEKLLMCVSFSQF